MSKLPDKLTDVMPPNGDILEETKVGGMFRWAHPDILKPRELTPQEKIGYDKTQSFLAEKAEVRDDTCWNYNCTRKAYVWVREVSFDFKGDKAEPTKHTAVSSGDYPGPVPGFCIFCIGTGPQLLAEAVYFDRPEMYWGVRPNRWFVSFTDGTIQGGECIELDPKQLSPKIVEETISGN